MEYEVVARELMENIAYDNGCVNRYSPMKYPKQHVVAIAEAAKVFFEASPDLLNNDTLDELATGEQGEVEEKYGLFLGYRELDEALDKYFDQL